MSDKYGRNFYAVTAANLKGIWKVRAKTSEEAIRLFRSTMFPNATGITAVQITENEAYGEKNPRKKKRSKRDKDFQKYLSAMSRSMVKGEKPKSWKQFTRRRRKVNPNYTVRPVTGKFGVYKDDRLYSKHATKDAAYDAMIVLQQNHAALDRAIEVEKSGRAEIDRALAGGPNYAHPTKTWHRRSRKKNPKIQNMFVIVAQRAGGPALKYIGGIRFAAKGRAVLFPSRKDATTAAREMKLRFPVLKGYTLSVQS